MAKHTDTPKSGYYVEVDVTDLKGLRKELGPRGIHVVVLELDGPAGGNPLVRLRSGSRTALVDWLRENDYDLDAHEIINALNPDSVAQDDF